MMNQSYSNVHQAVVVEDVVVVVADAVITDNHLAKVFWKDWITWKKY